MAPIVIAACLAAVVLVFLIGTVLSVESVPARGMLFRMASACALARTLSLHVGLALLAPLCVALFLRRRLIAVTCAGVIFWCIFPTVWEYRPRAPQPIAGESIRVMTCNLLRSNRRVEEIAQEVRAARPDIVCFQEYAPHWHDGLSPRLADLYPHRCTVSRQHDMGLAIYSMRPILGEAEWTDFDGDPPAQPLRVEIEIDGQRVALYNLHMYQPWPPSTMWRHCVQLAGMADRLAREELPTIVAGDFNATPTSPTMYTMKKLDYADAWELAGWGLGASWPDRPFVRHLPGIRIDHIYLSGELTSTECVVGTGAGSDHRPVIAAIGFLNISDQDPVPMSR
jgi:endonuclease/exonuclease/phosphatase (EEP) superfamily protein YafD